LSGLALLLVSSCAKKMPEIIDEITLGRCLVPTNVTAKVTNGEWVELNWDKSKSAESFLAEFYDNDSFGGIPLKSFSIPVEELPYLAHLEADVTYYLRVQAISGVVDVKDSKWYEHEKSIQTSAIKTSLEPEVLDRSSGSVTVKWTPDPEVDHIRIEPALTEGQEYTRFEVGSEAATTGSVEVTGLKPSTYYTLAVHFKSADRGSVAAWTRPSAQGAVEVADTVALKQAIADAAATILLTNLETPYVLGAITPVSDVRILGQGAVDGTKPVLAASFNIKNDVKNIYLEGLTLSGAASADPKMDIQNHVINVSDALTETLESVKVINCEISGYQRGIMYDNSKVVNYGDILFDGDVISDIPGTGGDFFDLRKSGTINSIVIKNSTITGSGRTLFRIDKNDGTFGKFELSNCTLNDLVNKQNSNNNGILHIRKAVTSLVVKNNLFLNMVGDDYCQLISHNTAAVMPTEIANNHYFNCQRTVDPSTGLDTKGFFYHKDAAGAETGAAELIVSGGSLLSSDPCVDSGAGKFNVTNTQILSKKVGDPRWLREYIDIPEDLTQYVTKNTPSAKTWNFNDSKTFYKAADKDMVRDGIRFYVDDKPVVFDGALLFTSAGEFVPGDIESSDCVASIKIDQPGSVVLSTATRANSQALLIVALDDKAVIGVPAGTENYMVTFADIIEGQEHMVYFYGSDAIDITELQWNNEIGTGGDKKLATPEAELDKTEVNEGEDTSVSVNWDAIEKAGSYGIIFNNKTNFTTDLSYSIQTKSLSADDYEVKVFAAIAADDKIRENSDTVSLSFTVKEVLKKITATTEWGATYMAAGVTKFGEGTELKTDMVYGNLGFVPGTSKFKFGTDNAGSASEKKRLQLGGTGTFATKACLQFIVNGSGKLTVGARSSGDAARDYKVGVSADALQSHSAPAKTAEPDTTTFTITATDNDVLNIFSANSGINLYYIKWVPDSEPQTRKMTWDFSSTAWVGQLTTNFAAINTNYTDTDFTYDGLRVLAGGGTIKYNKTEADVYFIQPGGGGSTSKRCFKFSAPEPGTLRVWVSNTGNSEDLTRNVVVSTQGTSPDPQAGGYDKSSGPHLLTFTVGTKGDVTFYPSSGLCFYKAEYEYFK